MMGDNQMKEKHIFLIFSNLGLGGIQRKMVDIVKLVVKNKQFANLKIHLVVRRPAKFNFIEQLPKNFGHLHLEYEFHQKDGRVGWVIFLSYLIRKYKPIVLVPFLQNCAVHTIAVRYLFFWRKIRVVVGQDNIASFEENTRYPKWLVGLFYNLASKVIVQTKLAKLDLLKHFSVIKNKVVVVNNWVLDTQLRSRSVVKQYDLIYAGRFSTQKQLLKLLELVVLIKQKKKNIKLCLVGSGEDKSVLLSYVKEQGLQDNVVFKSPTKLVIQELARAKVFVLTSLYEGQPMILLEAMTQEVVPVVLKYFGVSEYLEHGQTGFIESSLQEMKKQILFLLNNDKELKRVGKQAREKVLECYNDELIKQTLEIFLAS